MTDGAERARTVLLCAAPGTGLSNIADSLRPKPEHDVRGTAVWDLERYICEAFRDRDDEGNLLPRPKMSSIVMKDRGQLYRQWEQSFQQVLDEIPKSRAATRIVCMHLNWYNSEWNEFYSPIDVKSVTSEDCRIDHVVILIDDIYDMFSRLNQDVNLYDERSLETTMAAIRKLSIAGTTATPDDRQLRIQAVEVALGDLLAWRRAEMIQAENLARSLRCEFTIMATKHSKAALVALVNNVEAPRIYLSHRISEMRRASMQRSGDASGEDNWPPPAREVHALHSALASRGQVLINPTAIDEFRFENDPSTGSRKPRLSLRWPLPSQSLLWEWTGGSPEHSDLLYAGVPEDDEVACHAARSLSIRISSDVWFRDHAIVEHTPNLCVYRPFYCEQSLGALSVPNWSGGVGQELTHWTTYFTTRLDSLSQQDRHISRRVAFVHTDKEIMDRCAYLVGSGKPGFDGTILSHVRDRLDNRDFNDVIANNPGKFKSALATASLTACHHSMTRLGSRSPAANVLLCRVEEDEDRNVCDPDDIAEELSAFFAGALDENAVVRMNEILWSYYNLAFKQAAGMSPVLYALEVVDKDTPEIRELLGLTGQ